MNFCLTIWTLHLFSTLSDFCQTVENAFLTHICITRRLSFSGCNTVASFISSRYFMMLTRIHWLIHVTLYLYFVYGSNSFPPVTI